MKVKVESCWGGNSNFYFRLTTPEGARYRLNGDTWSRSLASEALDLVTYSEKSLRKSVRFVHV